MSRRFLTGLLAAAALAACATAPAGPPPFDPVGSYTYAADVNGQIIPGTMTVERGDDGYTGSVASDMFPPLSILSVEVDGQTVTIEVAGPEGQLLIAGTVSGDTIEGTWAMGEGSGTFTATKSG